MSANFDKISYIYRLSHQLPWRQYIEHHTFFELVGDITSKSVLDLACGDGFYSRKLKQLGAGKVRGVDISPEMIGLAQKEEEASPLGITYFVRDVTQLDLEEKFDLVVASYLLNYARTKEELLRMCNAISRHLKPEGRLVSVNNELDQDPASYEYMKKYGFTKSISGNLKEGTPITYHMYLEGMPTISFDNYYLKKETYESVFHSSGLHLLGWRRPVLSQSGKQKYDDEYWSSFFRNPPIVFIECRKDNAIL